MGNISANSWGTLNQLNYLRRYGLFEADIVVLVLNRGDALDVSVGKPIDWTLRQRDPACALEDVIFCGAIWLKSRLGLRETSTPEQRDRDSKQAIQGLRDMISLIRASGATVIVLQHACEDELDSSTPLAEQTLIASVCRELGIEPIDTKPIYHKHPGIHLDGVHLNAEGQNVLATIMLEAVVQAESAREERF